MGTPGPLEIGIILLVVLLFVGPKKLPGLGRGLGSGMREFKDSISGKSKDDDEDALIEPRREASAPVPPPAPVADPLAKPADAATPPPRDAD